MDGNILSEDTKILKEISKKLSQLIILWKISNVETIKNRKKEIEQDKISKKILELANGQLPSSSLKQEIAKLFKKSERTVERRLKKLVELGALTTKRVGNESYYENSGLYD